MNKRKIINDPIHGLVSFPFDFLYTLIDHRYFQRLRRISQMGLSNYVYPGATHSRFSHALGALHLLTVAVNTLREKGVDITDDEYLGTCIAILLHDIGHGPFSHGLEEIIVEKSHEEISLDIMTKLNEEYNGALDMAIKIFTHDYPKKFLSQLVSSQLDVDRLDYLARDSYFSGVAEGVIGYKRIISMLNVKDGDIVVEEKGLYSIEKFLVARHIMYWQVYLHKTSIASEQMLKVYCMRLKDLLRSNAKSTSNSRFLELLYQISTDSSDYLEKFIKLDDYDVFQILKSEDLNADPVLSILSNGIVNRKIFKVHIQNSPLKSDLKEIQRQRIVQSYKLKSEHVDALLIDGKESSQAYNIDNQEIKILNKVGQITPISEYNDVMVNIREITRYYLCYPA